jgi:NAD(P)-dependent dehydrogenase (short-subunit alcohol dehydrogenase family)
LCCVGSMQNLSSTSFALLAIAIPLATFPIIKLTRSRRRHTLISPTTERVLILGATSGVGRTLAHLYAKRGSRVCIVGRRKDAADTVRSECMALTSSGAATSEGHILAVAADFTDAESMVKLRDILSHSEFACIPRQAQLIIYLLPCPSAWGGVDTLAVVAGVSALRPLLATAGVQRPTHISEFSDATVEGVKESISIANAACSGNFIGPLTAAVTFVRPSLRHFSCNF